jgi:pyridoxal phosphate enzyme (YggS family)
MTITENLIYINSLLPAGVKLVAVSKTKSIEEIREAYEAGQRLFGENKVQELTSKWLQLPKDIEWHYIGHLQTNKVRQLVPYVSVIHSVDSLKLLSVINREAEKINRIILVLLEFHIAAEESKFGLSLQEAEEILASSEIKMMKNVRIVGVMGMATFTEDEKLIRSEFERLRSLFKIIEAKYFEGYDQFCEISMGMSDDYLIAVSAGSTIVRIGSKIFGARSYKNGL